MRVPKNWIITDTHWNHDMLVEQGLRPADYQSRIFTNWRRMVMDPDTIYHLGDVIFSKRSDLPPILAALPGRKILVRGNHDGESDAWYIRAGFAAVLQGALVGGVWLTHAPQATLPDGAIVNVHGHLHNDEHRKMERVPAHCKLLALENTNYEPVELMEFVGFPMMTRRILMPHEIEERVAND